MERLLSMPVQLLWFAVAEPTKPHPERLRVAKYLLATSSKNLHVTARKVKYLFLAALQYIVESGGRIRMEMYAFFKTLAIQWKLTPKRLKVTCLSSRRVLQKRLPSGSHSWMPE